MNKYTLKSLVVALVLLVPVLAFALPGAHDPSVGIVSACNNCHQSPASMGNTTGTFGTNVCLRCHGSSPTYSGLTEKSFAPADYADPFNTGGPARNILTVTQTSHKWFGGITVKAAGAQAPVDTAFNGLNKSSNFVSGGLFCARCHNVHGTSGLQSMSSPYLRYPNDSDQLCLNCHAPRDTQDHKQGTHPVNVNYTSARNANILANNLLKTTFRTSPVVNLTNSTGQVKLVKGKVVCSTCHKTHYSDSRTSTFDPYSTTHTFSGLSSSRGMLLRVDPYGKTPQNDGDLNICSNCHVTRNHNTELKDGKPAVQCMDCHSGHVEYDAAYPAELKNVNLVRRYLQYTTAGRISKRILYRSDTTKEFYNTTGNGVCQACHRPPADHYTGNTYSGAFPSGAYSGCAGCHNHAQPTGSWHYGTGGACSNACHGLPPTTATSPGPTGPVAGYTRLNETLTPHASHAAGGGPNANDFDCNECHNGYGMPNVPSANPNYIEVFKTPKTLPGLTASYNSATFECSNVYCHSTGRGTWKAGMNPISWQNTRYSIIGQPDECQHCHDDPNSSAAHTRHVIDRGYGCVLCHAATVSSNTTHLASAKQIGGTHTNGTKDVLFSGTGAAVGTTCANVACHSNGKGSTPIQVPVWTDLNSGKCGDCHLTGTSAPVLNTGSHTKHFLEIGGTDPAVVCARCHIFTTEIASTHSNGTLNVTTGCSTCHASPYSSAYSTPTWGTSSSGCGSCHSGVGSFTGTGQGPNTGSHNKHMAFITVNCGNCHNGAQAGTTGGTSHGSEMIDVSQGYPSPVVKHAAGSGYKTCSAATCHASSYAATSIVTPTWGVVTGCGACHTGVGAFTGTGSSPNTGSHTKHMAISGTDCADCHTGALISSYTAVSHFDGNIDVSNGYLANVTKHTQGSGYRTCATASCHASSYAATTIVTTSWGAGGTGGCSSCHSGVGAFTGTGSSPNTGAHTRHMALVGSACNQCHANATLTSYNDAAHRDANIDVTGGYTANVTKHASGSGYTSTCSTTLCHGSTSPTWGAQTANDQCTKCHGIGTGSITAANRYLVAPPKNIAGVTGTVSGTGQVSNDPKVGAHQTHMRYLNGFSNYSTVDYRCEACHGTLPIAATASVVTHADGSSSPTGKFKNLANKWGAGTPSFNSGTFSCANTYCHNPSAYSVVAQPGTNSTPTWTNTNYIADGGKSLANCQVCHLVPGSTGFSAQGSHSAMVTDASANQCNGCHGHNGDTAGVLGERHIDGKRPGAVGGSCDGCHDYDTVGSTWTGSKWTGGTWGKAATNYGQTAVVEGWGAHAKHINYVKTRSGIAVALTAAGQSFGIGQPATVCGVCHSNTGGDHNMGGSTTDPGGRTINFGNSTFLVNGTNFKFGASNPIYNGTSGVSSSTDAKTCSNISCHYFTTPLWSTY